MPIGVATTENPVILEHPLKDAIPTATSAVQPGLFRHRDSSPLILAMSAATDPSAASRR